jgi:hypothetical protein
MNALRLPSNDQERMQVLSSIYAKGLSTPKDELAFSSDLLGYLRPFITKLQSGVVENGDAAANLSLVRQVVDELISDIYAEVQAACLRMGGKRGERLAADYGLQHLVNPFEGMEYYYSAKKVA